MEAVIPGLIEGQGTPESGWRAWLALEPLPAMSCNDLLKDCRRVVIVAPHPDDEILGAAGLLRYCTNTAMPCTVVAVTDGDASHPDSPLWPKDRLAHARAQESAEALALLNPRAQIHRLGLPDGSIADHARRLAGALQRTVQPADAVFCTWRHDGHPDHEATGEVCATVARQLGCRLFELPIWAWHWAVPDDPRVPWHSAVAIPMTVADLALKCQALSCFRSQLMPDHSTGKQPILPEWATRRLLRPFEVVFR
ncbi:MAG TPA: PIG-L family deacetylase [Burkholderiaceae bacterium]